jgi:hypothetical protein
MQYKVYAASSHSPLHTETPANAVQYTVTGETPFEALGAANRAALRCGIDIREMKRIEITQIPDNICQICGGIDGDHRTGCEPHSGDLV